MNDTTRSELKQRLLQLAERCEAATGGATAPAQSERALLEDAWAAIHGSPPRRNRGGDNPENRFVSMLDARAYESAAMTLVPEGLCVDLRRFDSGGGFAQVRSTDATPDDTDDELYVESAHCATPALALCAAALRARSLINGDDK